MVRDTVFEDLGGFPPRFQRFSTQIDFPTTYKTDVLIRSGGMRHVLNMELSHFHHSGSAFTESGSVLDTGADSSAEAAG